jgi:hypothetical protein
MRNDLTVLVAPGRDGDRASAALEAIGCRIVRGATGRGGAAALRRLIHDLRRSDSPAGLVVDGPLGPARRARGGAVVLAARTGRPLRALGVAVRRALVFSKTWSGIFLPLPFSIVTIGVVDVPPARPGRPADVATLGQELTEHLALARQRARQAMGKPAGAVKPAPTVEEGHPPRQTGARIR